MSTLLSSHPSKPQSDRIRDDIRRQLQWQSDIQSNEIQVEVADSVVTLSGSVQTRLEKLEAEHAAKAVYGVSSVTNSIVVKPKCSRADQEIQDDINAGLRLFSCVLEEPPQVLVNSGVVTLRGKVRWNFQRESATRAADAVAGVREVNNLIEVISLTPAAACRKSARKRPDTTPSSINQNDSQSGTCGRPMFYIPYSVGRA